MRQSHGPGEEPIETESRRLTPSIGLKRDSDQPTDSSNEDFLFHLYRGSELLQDNRVHEAKEELERALHLQPRDSKGQDLLAVVYFRLGLYPRAIQIYEQLRRRNSGDTALLLNLALCYLKTGQAQLARRDLEQLLALNPTHARAWGYLGLACERMGDLAQAERAFQQGGHGQMAKRVAARREFGAPKESAEQEEVREVAGAAYQELDAGELSFALAEPTQDRFESAQSWLPHDIALRATERGELSRPETRKPDTKDGAKLAANEAPGMIPSIPQLGLPQSLNRRPTLIAPVGAPPMHELPASEIAAVERIPSQKPPSIVLEDGFFPPVPSLRRPVVAVPSPFGPPRSHEVPAAPNDPNRTRTLPPPVGANNVELLALSRAPHELEGDEARGTSVGLAGSAASVAAPARHAEVESLLQPSQARPSERRPEESVRFPDGGVVLHPSGVALVRTTTSSGFAARLEAIRAQQSGLAIDLLERHVKGKPNGESFGGVASPMVFASGEGELVLGARPGRKLTALRVTESEMCFTREDVLLGFDGSLSFENGRLTTGESEHVPVVQLRGQGSVLLETIGDVLTLAVRADRSLSVRRETILGWFGRLVPRALAPSDAPCGQRGLVSFAGEGRILFASS